MFNLNSKSSLLLTLFPITFLLIFTFNLIQKSNFNFTAAAIAIILRILPCEVLNYFNNKPDKLNGFSFNLFLVTIILYLH
jgi:hypothetical protein